MADILSTLEDDDLFRAGIACSGIIDNWVGEECVGEGCKNTVSEEDVEKIIGDTWLVSQDHEPVASQPMCYDCDKDYFCRLEGVDGDCRERHPDNQ